MGIECNGYGYWANGWSIGLHLVSRRGTGVSAWSRTRHGMADTR